jgi:predicted nucleic acid-binding protein
MNVVDTSGWLEFFEGGGNAKEFLKPIKKIKDLLIPTICIYEVSKVVLRESDEDHLLQALAAMQKGKVIELSPSISISAAKLSLKHRIPMADSIIYATAQRFNAIVWTQDNDFEDLPNVKYLPKK